MSVLPATALGSVSTTVAWNPSPDSSVTGYNVYYGTTSHGYTNMISVGNVSSATISNLSPGLTYYFAATAHDAAGNQSGFSNEASFAGYNIGACSGTILLKTLPPVLNHDSLAFSLAAGAPTGASINPTNGVFTWTPSLSDANSVNRLTVIISDLTNPGASTQTAIQIAISDYLNTALTSVPVLAGQSASLPLTVVTSDPVTNMVFNLSWPGNLLATPTLKSLPSKTTGTIQNQGANLVIRFSSTGGGFPAGTNQLAVLNFRAASGQASAFLNLPSYGLAAQKNNGSSFARVVPGVGQVVVVGTTPMLQPVSPAGPGRRLAIYANPGKHYQLQYRTSLSTTGSWQLLQAYQPTNVLQTLQLDSVNPVVFYRLVQQ